MSRYILIFFILPVLLYAEQGFSGTVAAGNDKGLSQISSVDTLPTNQVLYNGRVWRNLYYRVREDQFLFSSDFLPGSITLSSSTFNNIEIRYDIFSDEILIPKNNGSVLQVNKEMVDSFNIGYLNRLYYFKKVENDSIRGFNGYVNIVYNGKSHAYVKFRKEIALLAVDGKYDSFYQIQSLFIEKDDILYTVKSRRELIKLFADRKTEIRSYIKKNRLNISVKIPESIVPLLKFYDSLGT